MPALRFLTLAIATLFTAAGPAVAALATCCCSAPSQPESQAVLSACCAHEGEEAPAAAVETCCSRHIAEATRDSNAGNPGPEVNESHGLISGCCCIEPVPATVRQNTVRQLVEASGLLSIDAILPSPLPVHPPDDHEFPDPGLNFAPQPPLNVLKCVWLE